MQSKKHHAIYHRATANGAFGGRGLLRVVDTAFRSTIDAVRIADDWHLRVMEAATDSPDRLFVNDLRRGDTGSYLFGDLILYSHQEAAAYLEDQSGGQPMPRVDIRQLQPGQTQHFVKGIAFWLIVDDHVLLVQHPRIRVRAVEKYLKWLIADQSQAITEEFNLSLHRQVDRDKVRDAGDVKSVSVSAGYTAPGTAGEQSADGVVVDTVRGAGRQTFAISPESDRLQLLRKALLMLGVQEQRLTDILNSVHPGDELRMHLGFTIKSRDRKRRMDRAALNAIVNATRDIEDDVVIKTDGGSTLSGREATLSEEIKVEYIRDLPDPDSVLTEMLKALARLQERARLDP